MRGRRHRYKGEKRKHFEHFPHSKKNLSLPFFESQRQGQPFAAILRPSIQATTADDTFASRSSERPTISTQHDQHSSAASLGGFHRTGERSGQARGQGGQSRLLGPVVSGQRLVAAWVWPAQASTRTRRTAAKITSGDRAQAVDLYGAPGQI